MKIVSTTVKERSISIELENDEKLPVCFEFSFPSDEFMYIGSSFVKIKATNVAANRLEVQMER